MKAIERYYGKIDKGDLVFNENEIALRLNTGRGYTNDIIEKCKKVLLDTVDCHYCGIRLDVICGQEKVDFGDFSVDSTALAKNLHGISKCFIMAVTLGSPVDRLLKRLSVSSSAEYYITDALASALAECAADKAELLIKGECKCRVRFSPGYADFSIEKQADVLKVLDAGRLLGISLSKSFLMTPQKTITAVIGII